MRPAISVLRQWEGLDCARVVSKLPTRVFTLGAEQLHARIASRDV